MATVSNISHADSEVTLGENKRALPSTFRTNLAVFILFLVMTFNLMDRAIIMVLLEPIGQEFNLPDRSLGLLVGLPFAFFYALVGLPAARLADVGNRRVLIAATIALFSLATAASGLAAGFVSLFLLRILVGIGEGAGTPAVHSALADYVSPSRRSLAASLFPVSSAAGGLLGFVLGGMVAQIYDWRMAFILIGLPGVAIAVLAYFILPEPRQQPRWPNKSEIFGGEALDVLRRLWSNSSFKLLLVAFTLLTFVQMATFQWAAVFLVRQYEMSIATVGLTFGLVCGFSVAVGALLGGFIGNLCVRWGNAWLMRLPAYVCLALIPSYLAYTLGGTAFMALAGMGVATGLGGAAVSTTIAAIYTLSAPHERATAVALAGMFTTILGLGLGPVCVGVLSDVLTAQSGENSLRDAQTIILVLLVPAALCYWKGAKYWSERPSPPAPENEAA